MKDLQTLVQHPSVQGANMLVLNTGKPIVLVRGHERSSIGGALSSQQIMGLLKSSLNPEVVGGFKWGQEFKVSLVVGDSRYPIVIGLKPDKTFHVELTLSAVQSTEVSTLEPGAIEPPAELDDAVLEQLTSQLTEGEHLGLIYFTDFQAAGRLEEVVTNLGYQPRKTNEAAAVLEVLKYGDFPLFLMQCGAEYRRDPVLDALANMNMDGRRTQYSVLIGPGLTSGDTMLAYSLSVHLTLNESDLADAAAHIERGRTSWQRFTAPFHQFLEAKGRL